MRGLREVDQSIKCLPSIHEDPSLIPLNLCEKLGVLACAGGVETGGFLGLLGQPVKPNW